MNPWCVPLSTFSVNTSTNVQMLPPVQTHHIKRIMVDVEFSDGERWGLAGAHLCGEVEVRSGGNATWGLDLNSAVAVAKSSQGLLVVKLQTMPGSELGLEQIAGKQAA